MNFNVSLYDKTPGGFNFFPDLLEYASHRLELYRIFQMNESLSLDELKTHLKNSPLLHLLELDDSKEVQEARKIDLVSHWILRIAYRSKYKYFFIKNELRWFKIRFNNMPAELRKKFIESINFVLVESSQKELEDLGLSEEPRYKVPFTQATTLVRKKLCPLHKGFAFIAYHKVVFLLMDALQKELKWAFARYDKIPPESINEQLNTIVDLLDLVTPFDYRGVTNNPITLTTLPEKVHNFPLCMKIQYDNLKENHHLKYFSRVQYGLFLKGIGLSITDALKMWHDEFTKIMSEEDYKKEKFEYFFQHQYGLKGSKINFNSLSCEEIQEQAVPPGQIHGCPFIHWDDAKLQDKLRAETLKNTEIQKIIDLKKQGKCREACTRYFQAFHGIYEIETVSHPNQYYQKSCETGLCDIEALFEPDNECLVK